MAPRRLLLQLLLLDSGAASSSVQIRGSVPLLWEQHASLKYTPKVVLSANAAGGLFLLLLLLQLLLLLLLQLLLLQTSPSTHVPPIAPQHRSTPSPSTPRSRRSTTGPSSL